MSDEPKKETCERCKRPIKGTAHMKKVRDLWRPFHFSCAQRVKSDV